jgi:REP element-mobilizing transposase RayT
MLHLPQRKSPRLQGYDYSAAGAYFVTICTHQRQPLFGRVEAGAMQLSAAGAVAAVCWDAIQEHYRAVELDAFVVMPNHVHGILVLSGNTNTFKTILGRVINGYKGAVTARLRQEQPDLVVWQGRYHDHIIRDEKSLNRIQGYILTNPERWTEDTFYHP